MAMMKQALTDAFIKSIASPATGRLEFADLRCAGLTLRITLRGIRSWSFRFRDPATGRVGRATIGQYPTVGLSAARERANDMRKEVSTGNNPALRRRRERIEAPAKTFGVLASRYLVEYARRKKRSHARDERNLEKHILPRWRERSYESIKRADVIELLEGLVGAGKPVLANRVQSLISGIFGFAIDASLVDANPCSRLRKRGVENVGQRVLSDPEIRLFWNGIAEPMAARRIGLGLRLALLTGGRSGEVVGMSRGELEHLGDITRSAWIVPGARVKNARTHLVPLSPLARETVLDLLELIEPDQQFLFPKRLRHGQGPVRNNAMSQAMVDFRGRMRGDGDAVRTWRIEPPTPHDLRRTVGTRLAELRVPKEIRDRVLNHIPTDIGSKHYNLHDFADEKRLALNLWANALAVILDTGGAAYGSLRVVPHS